MIEKGHTPPTIIIERVKIPKSEDKEDKNKIKTRRKILNAKTMNALTCASSSNEFNRVCNYEMAKKFGTFRSL